jgi:signal transduction histidine kinase
MFFYPMLRDEHDQRGVFAPRTRALRALINDIIGFSEVIASEKFSPINPKYREFAECIQAGARHLTDLSVQVINLSMKELMSVRVTKEKITPQPVSLMTMARPSVRSRAQSTLGCNRLDIVNSIRPGLIQTDMGEQIFVNRARNLGSNDLDAVRQQAMSRHPIGRLGVPDDIAKGIVFLPPTMPAL